MQYARRLVAILAALTLVANLAAWSAGAHAYFEPPGQDLRSSLDASAGSEAPADSSPQLSNNSCVTHFGCHCQGSLCSIPGVALAHATHCQLFARCCLLLEKGKRLS
jgi:hypothetical protein